ncbi:MAG: DNA polymerase III subunit gamma/tau [Ignavibacterium sp.]
MGYQVSARKYRPQRFDEVVGQEHITNTLKNAIKSGRIAHAYLFTGPRGIGKTTTARILAKSINCLNQIEAEPCGECKSCVAIQNSLSMDFVEIDAASNRGIEDVKNLLESVKYTPSQGKYKVYIIDEVHMLTTPSFNAFLKTLEEPPEYVVFIFATTDVHKLPPTIISRCQQYDFRRIKLNVIKSLLLEIAQKENIKIDDKSLTMIAKKADGGLRDAESLFDQAVAFCGKEVDFDTVVKIFNFIDEDVYFEISDAILNKNFQVAFDVVKKIYDNGWNFIDFNEGLIEHFRNIMTVIVTKSPELIEASELSKKNYLKYIDISSENSENQFSEGDILRILNFLSKTLQELRFTQNLKVKFEITLCQLIGLEKTSTISQLISSINKEKEQQSNFVKEETTNKYNNESNKSFVQEKKVVDAISLIKESSATIVKDNNKQTDLFNFDSIVKKWTGFVDEIKTERSLIFGPLLSKVTPISLERNNLKISVKDSDGKILFEANKDYFAKKAFEYFGKKLDFSLVDEVLDQTDLISKNNIVEQKKSSSIQESTINHSERKANKNSIDNPIINFIVKELGGEEIL